MDQSVPTEKEAVDRVIAGGVSSPVRSEVYVWMKRHHTRLAAQFEGVRVQWAGVAAKLAELGIKDVNGNPPKAASVRRTWWRVRRDVAAGKGQAADKRTTLQPENVQGHAVAAAPTVPPTADPAQDYPHDVERVDDEAPTRTTFRTSGGLKKWPTPTAGQE